MPFEAGFALLAEKRYQLAIDYFMSISSEDLHSDHNRNRIKYGLAEAYMGLKQYELAQPILHELTLCESGWEEPYLTLARLYEEKGYLHVACSIYLDGIRYTRASEKPSSFLESSFECFINNYATFTPGLRVYLRSISANESLEEEKPRNQLDRPIR
jgi:tetratricopeptide (TPR) repeat protein